MPPLGLTLATLLFAPQLAVHLAGWEKQSRDVTTFKAEYTLTRQDGVFGKERRYSGAFLGMTSGHTRLRMDNVEDKRNYEAIICDGRSVYCYSGLEKTVTELRLPPPGPPDGFFARIARGLCPAEQFAVRLVSGATAKEAATRFDVSLFKEEGRCVYLDLRPRSPEDRLAVKRVRVVLHGPGVNPPQVPYTPAELFVLKPNGDTEHWKFSEVKVNLSGVNEKLFQYEKVPGFTLKKAPAPAAPPGPGKP